MQTAPNDTITPVKGAARLGAATVLLVLSSVLVARLLGAAWTSAWREVTAPGPAAVDELVTLVVSGLAAGLAAWFLGGVALELVARVPGRCGDVADRCSRRASPALARRTVALVLGLGIGVGGGPAQATTVGTPDGSVVVATAKVTAAEPAPDPGFAAAVVPVVAPTAPPAPEPGFTPARPRVRPQADPGLLGARVAPVPEEDVEVVVHRGDSLWSIAARRLGHGASDAEIDRSWRELFALNREVVGADPDLLLPGQLLRLPDPDASRPVAR